MGVATTAHTYSSSPLDPPIMVDLLAMDAAAAASSSASHAAGIISSRLHDDGSSEDSSYSSTVASSTSSSPSAAAAASRKYDLRNKRFAWPDDLHRLFVAAIFDLGLMNASPKALLPFMEPAASSAGLTTEHLKSHLQKYRLHHERSRAEFLAFYDEAAAGLGRRRRRGHLTEDGQQPHAQTKFIFPIEPPQDQLPPPPVPMVPQPQMVSAMLEAQESLIRQSQAQMLMQQAMALAAQAGQPLVPTMPHFVDRSSIAPMDQQQVAGAPATTLADGSVAPWSGSSYGQAMVPMVANNIEDSVAMMSFQEHHVPPVLRQQMRAVMQEHRAILSRKGEVTQRWDGGQPAHAAMEQQPQLPATPTWGMPDTDMDMDMDDPDELFRFLRQSDD